MEKINAEVFLEVVRAGSFKTAAEKLGYTQAGVSYIIKAMENELGLVLFDREYGGVKLSSEGKEVLYYIEQINANEKLLKAKANEIRSLDIGSVSVRCFNSVSIHWLPGIVEEFHEKHPNITVSITSTDDDVEVEKMVSEQAVDCGFFALPFYGKLDTFMLHESPIMISVSPDHPLADLEYVPVGELNNYPIIRMSYDDRDHYLQEVFDLLGGIPKESYIVDNDYAALAMASKNMGYCLFPKMALQGVPFPLKHIELKPRLTMKVCIGVKSYKHCSRATKEFIKCTREWVRDNVT